MPSLLTLHTDNGTTACKWDTVIPFDKMWERLNKLIKPNGAIVLFSSQPFTSVLISSNIKNYKYNWIWNKRAFANQMMAKFQPLRITEDICVFSEGKAIYNPQGLIKCDKITKQGSKITDNIGGGERKTEYFQQFTNYPKNILEFGKDKEKVHPTQKPVALIEYLIKTYSLENDVILDFTSGSGTTGIAAQNTNRQFILIEKDKNYYDISLKRLQENQEILNSLTK